MNVTFYAFSKRINSTKQPAGGTSYSVTLKSGSSVTAPRIGILWQGGGSPAAYNYAYISSYYRFYYVKNWTYEERQWWADLVVDPLASYKAQIGASSHYVLRASAAHSMDAVDTMWPIKTNLIASGAITGGGFGWSSYGGGGGTYVATVIGKGNSIADGSVAAQYQMSGGTLQAIITNAVDAVQGWYNAQIASTTIREAVQTLLSMPFRASTDLTQYIKNLMWFPFSFPSGGAAGINLGIYNCGSASTVGTPVINFSSSISVPGMAAGKEKWEYLEPYGKYWFRLMPFGVFELSPIDVIGQGALFYTCRVDSMSGLGTFTLRNSDTKVLASGCAQIGIAVPYGSAAPNYAGAITTGAATAIAAGMSGMGQGSALAAGLAGAGKSFGISSLSSSGSAGGGGALEGVGYLYYRVNDHAAIDNAHSGRPYCSDVAISSIPGYILCKDGEVEAPATSDELAAIESYLTGGFFYE